MKPGIEVSSLTKKFYPHKRLHLRNLFTVRKECAPAVACDHLSFSVAAGKALGVIGPNGSGKTTLVRILAGSVLADEGEARIHGFDIVKEQYEAKGHVSVILAENKNFYLRLTGRENLRFFASFYNIERQAVRRRIEEISALLHIEEYLDRVFQEYSSGIKQRFTLARGFLNDAKVLLMDEPTKSLDPAMAEAFRLFVKQKLLGEKKKTILLTSHTLSEVSEIADEIAILNRGQINALGSLGELKQKAGEKAGRDLESLYRFFIH